MAELDIEFRGVEKSFGSLKAVKDINLTVEKGEFHSFLGASGCGKTTTLRMIAGFEQPTVGDVFIAGKNMNGVPAYKRPVNMVFQHYALFPHLDVAENVAYGLVYQDPKPSKAEMDRMVDEALEMVRMTKFKKRRTFELSGGQQQRIALARALVNKPTVLLLDEPLAALDRKLRKEMQTELLRLQREVGITFVMVTHDQEEALSLSDKVSVMHDGRIVQVASPRELYNNPASAYVADFIGEANLIYGEVLRHENNQIVVKANTGAEITASSCPTSKALMVGDECCVSLRPDQVRLASLNGNNPFVAEVTDQIFLGNLTEYEIQSESHGALTARCLTSGEGLEHFARGDKVALHWSPEHARVLPLK